MHIYIFVIGYYYFLQKSNEDVKWEVENYDTTSPFYNEELPEEIANSPAVNHLPDSSTPISNHNIYNLTDENCSKEDRLINGDISRNDLSNESSTEKIEEVSYESENPLKTGRRKTCMKVTKKYHVSSENGSKSTPIKKVVHRCEPCKKYFYGIHRYEGHMKQVHDGIKNAYQCKHCNKAYRFYKNLHDHIASSHSNEVNDAESFKCNDCNKVYKTKVNLQTHITNKHQNSKSIICDQCGFIGSSIYGLNRHIKNKHLVPEKIKCEHCPKVFKNQYYLKYHKLNFHNPQDIRPFKCSVCDMTFTRIALLNAHKRTHLKLSERIKCDYEGCEVRFLFNGEKTKHIRLVHLKVKQYVCDICNQAFGTAPTLRYHRYIHTGEKPFSCNCGQKFRQSSALKTHQKTHKSKTENSGQIIGI